MSAHEAWKLVCRLFAGDTPVFRGALSPAEAVACATLGPAIKATVVNQTYVLCPYCQLRIGQIFGDSQGRRICQCPDCGSIPLAAEDRAAVKSDEGWLMSRLRIALEIESRDGVTNLGEGVWRLGEARKSPVLLARSRSTCASTPRSSTACASPAPASQSSRRHQVKPVAHGFLRGSSGCHWTNGLPSTEAGLLLAARGATRPRRVTGALDAGLRCVLGGLQVGNAVRSAGTDPLLRRPGGGVRCALGLQGQEGHR